MTHTMNTEIWPFLVEHGVSLADSGSSEKGLNRYRALEFLNLLSQKNLMPTGLEVWRFRSSGRYEISPLHTWAPLPSTSLAEALAEVEQILRASENENDLFTIQF